MSKPVIRPLLESDLDAADRVHRIAFGTRFGLPDPIKFRGDAQIVRPRWATEPDANLVAESDGTIIGGACAMSWGSWSFRPASNELGPDSWSAWLPVDRPLKVRSWQAGDTMVVRADGTERKVKRFLSDAGITGHERAGWPVVLAGDQIVWIPGIRRGDAATARSGRPGLAFVCEYVNR